MTTSKLNRIKVEEKPTSQLSKLLAEGDFIKIPKVGELVKGTVIDISKSEVRIDIDGLTTGVVRGREFYDESSESGSLKAGDVIEATVIDLENENGEMELSLRFASHQRAWDGLANLRGSGEIVNVEITDANKGGLMVKVGKIPGFLPVSQLSPEHYPRVPGGDKNRILERLRSYIGKKFEVKVMDTAEAEDKLIVSEKLVWEEKQKEVIASFKVGTVVEGKITAVTDFGVFVEFGQNLEGLIHISELAWQRIDDPGNLFKVGDLVKAEIINIDGSKIFLSTKKLKKDPWSEISKRYQVGQVVSGKILKINLFGLFVELDPEIHGLAHISELNLEPNRDLKDQIKIGDVLEFKIISVEPMQHRLGLSQKAALPKPAKKPVAENAPEPTGTPVPTPAEPINPQS
ncbi:MAG: hypothetical protein A2744_01750 [Candidatus Buchananbacteria bacterium RIFCSPHIGHO2_01_FULL_44_11]|uniref:S1 motif domain-containing protein n=1 Tax=Candidatus Buchananbacteria bacterium RIFCSPHIGHO2_01_FULL_44_11 TaxID=1797535 RepID=A0A1G1Y201_9BACT|nr:MAG: hypothetical protein A2744_01750 [Candidatus Buchananbacteria bacterium RIFCSPHIGHO2_01_FULL_44_11]